VLTINILYALPRTPLWERLERDGRLSSDGHRESNVEFLQPYDAVVAAWKRCIAEAYTPEAVYRRFAHQTVHTFPHRGDFPVSPHRSSWRNVLRGVAILARVIWRVGVRSDYRRTFWRMAGPALRRKQIEEVIHLAVVSHHLIRFTRDCLEGAGESSFYSPSGTSAPTSTPSATAV
jgi:hopanoid C-2 methylase